jgi:hypothetical protein
MSLKVYQQRWSAVKGMIDYTQPADPPLSDEEMAWAGALLQDAGLR